MGMPLRQRFLHENAQFLQTWSFLIHSWQMNTEGSSFLSLVEHIQAFTGEFCFASELFFENIKATVWRAIKPLHSVVPTDLLEVSIMKGIDKYKVCSIIMTQNKFEKSSNILTNLVL